MTQSSTLPRQVIMLAVVLPLAAVLGYMLATPTTSSFMFLGVVLAVICSPVFLRWHHPILIFSWNVTIYLILLPGQPALWILCAFISLFISVLNRIMDRESAWVNVPAVTWPLLVTALIVVVTIKVTGGIGLAALGNEKFGGKKAVFALAGIAGYFALSCQPIPLAKAHRYVGLFLLSGVSSAVSNFAYLAGPAFYVLYYIFPSDFAMSQAVEDFYGPVLQAKFARLTGVTFAGVAMFQYLMTRHGIQGIFQKPMRLLLLMVVFGLSTLGGFRSAMAVCGLAFAIQFCFEKLYRTRLVLVLLLGAVVGGALLVPFADRLPLSVQRSLSFLPVKLDPIAKADAQTSVEWRVEMWKVMATQIPQYFWIGKGYALNPTDLYMAEEARKRGFGGWYDVSMLSGDYHSGPLSLLIPFGIFGTLAFIWFQCASIWVLVRNYRYGDPHLKTINTGLLSFFVARAIFYWFFTGAFNSDLIVFAGLVGFGVALNGGVAKPPSPEQAQPAAEPQTA